MRVYVLYRKRIRDWCTLQNIRVLYYYNSVTRYEQEELNNVSKREQAVAEERERWIQYRDEATEQTAQAVRRECEEKFERELRNRSKTYSKGSDGSGVGGQGVSGSGGVSTAGSPGGDGAGVSIAKQLELEQARDDARRWKARLAESEREFQAKRADMEEQNRQLYEESQG
jgi:hypothetical protein